MGDIKRYKGERRREFEGNAFAKALAMYLIELAREAGTDRFHCSQLIPANPYYKPEHTKMHELTRKWSQFAHCEEVAACFPDKIVYDGTSGWFTVTV